jgi:ribosomal protein L7/L12
VADLLKLVNHLSNLTILEAAELSKMLKEKWDTRQPGKVPAARKPTEGADAKLVRELIFQPSDVVLQPFGKEEKAKGKTPDFKLMRGTELCGYCELKSPRDDWVFEFPDDIKPGEAVTETRSSPTSNNLARQIESAVEQFDAVNLDHKLPNVLAIVNHAAGRTISDLHTTVTGIQVPDGPRLYALKPDRQKQIWKAARRVDLFLWIDAQNRTWHHAYPNDAAHRAKACGVLGIEMKERDAATSS